MAKSQKMQKKPAEKPAQLFQPKDFLETREYIIGIYLSVLGNVWVFMRTGYLLKNRK